MGKVSNAVSTEIGYTHSQFSQSVKDNEIFSLNRNRHKHQIQGNIRKQHTKCQQDTENSSGSTDGYKQIIEISFVQYLSASDVHQFLRSIDHVSQIKIPRQFLHQSGTNTRHHVKDQETLWSPNIFKDTTEHIHSKHIEKYMRKRMRIMHEHIGNQLKRIKIGGSRKMQSQ